MNYIQGIIKAIIFHSEENSYTILKAKVTDSTEDLDLFKFDEFDYVTITGYFPMPLRGEEIKFFGDFKEHKKYGMQYIVRTFEKISETSIPGLIEYLSSDLFTGIGPKTATSIVNVLGKDTIKLIMEDKTVLNTVPKLKEKTIETVYNGIIENKASENVLIKLYGYGITPKMAVKIYKFYQNETIAIIENNPYQLINDVEGIGFERADKIAKMLGFKDDHPLRVKAIILYLFNLMGNNYGHTFLYKEQLNEYLLKSLNKDKKLVDESILNKYVDELIKEKVFVENDEIIKLRTLAKAEKNITDKFQELSKIDDEKIDEKKVNDYISLFEQVNEIEYTHIQKKAILTALRSNLFILTGGPGTGKTTVIKGIVFVYCKYHQIPILYDNPLFEVKLIAPTGRAAKRMNETTNLHAETIHRFLGYSFDGKFTFNKDSLVDGKLIIIDESSMIDVYLASQLLQAIPKDAKIIFVGDENQLPSVGPGQFLKDIIDSVMINYIELKTIHRQSLGSKIIELAHSIKNSEVPSDLLSVYDDRYFVKENSVEFQSRLTTIIHYLHNKDYSIYEDIQVLIPMYRGSTGIDSVNKLIQNEFNPNTQKTIEHGDREFRIGDKVIQLVNQIEDNVMNGDQGIVIGITDDKLVIVDFLGNEVIYKIGDLINLKHAYAMSVHKSQGSEYKVVIMPIFKSYSIMLKRKLIYTAITRAKEKLIIIGDYNAFSYGVEKLESLRQSVLKDLIIDEIMNEKQDDDVIKKQSLPSGMPFDHLGEEMNEDISPYSFMED